MTATPSNDAALQGNYDVDYVIRYTFGGPGKLQTFFSLVIRLLMALFQLCRPTRSKRAAQQPVTDSCGSGVSDRSQAGRSSVFVDIHSSAAQEFVKGYAYYSVQSPQLHLQLQLCD